MKAEQALDAARELQLVANTSTDVMFHGLSMDPLLFEGDIVVVEPVQYGEIKIGDIITYRYLDRFPTRRVVAIHPDRLVLWCDAWPDQIFATAPDNVLGHAVARIRNGYRLGATDREWIVRCERALRSYRRTRPRREVRRVVGGVRRRVGLSAPRTSDHEQR
jgi:hypothetical protein